MSKRKIKGALRQLARQRHDVAASEALFNEMNQATDRAFVIIYAALVEDVLRSAIAGQFKPLSAEDDRKIFEDSGPLAGFYSKTLVGHAIGLIDETQKFDLDHIREIRNAFAHAVVGLSFNDKAVTDVCVLLKLPDVRKLPRDQQTARWRFCLSCSILLLKLSGRFKGAYVGVAYPVVPGSSISSVCAVSEA